MLIDPNLLLDVLKQSIKVAQDAAEAESKPQTPPESIPELTAEQIIVPVSPFDGLDDDDLLYWATPYYDELQAKKAKLKPKEEEL